MKKFLFSVAVFSFFMLLAGNVSACSCELSLGKSSEAKKVKNSYWKAAAVFYGKVIEITQKPGTLYVTVKLQVEKSWKNQLENEVIIQTGLGNGDCGYKFEKGERYLVYAYGNENSLSTNICQRTSESDKDSKYLDKIKRPKLFSNNSK